MDRREVPQITQYTFADQRSNKESWYNSAISFHEGANVLGQHKDSIHGGMRVFLANAALSLELLLKAIIVAKGEIARQTHDLPKLSRDAGVAYTESQVATLELLAAMLKWGGRYPVPNSEKDWDHYHDQIFERHVIREREGNISRMRANPETFPSVENYGALWDIANSHWKEIQLH